MPGPMAASTRGHDRRCRDAEPQPRAQREDGEQAGGEERELAEEAQDEARVALHQLGADPGADDEADELHRLDRGGDEPAGPLVEAVHLLVEEAGERREADERRGEERQRPPDAPEALDATAQPPRLAEAGGASSVMTASSQAPMARRSCAPRTGSRSLQAEHDDDERRDGEDEERRPPAEVEGEQPGDERADERADRVGGAVEGVHLRPVLGLRSSRRSASCASGRRPPCRCPSPSASTTRNHTPTPGRCRSRTAPTPPRRSARAARGVARSA